MRIERTFTYEASGTPDDLEVDNVAIHTTYTRTLWERLRRLRPRVDGPVEIVVHTADCTVTVRYPDDR